jgi:branched-chain amino acid transport system ATP-binding protein
MLALGRALVSDAKVILADELSVGLAPLVVEEIFAVLRSMQADGRSLLIVEQYVDRVLDAVDYVYILHKGRVVFVGEPDQCRGSAVFERYLGRHQHERTAS